MDTPRIESGFSDNAMLLADLLPFFRITDKIFCADARIAPIRRTAAQMRGLRVPSDFFVIGRGAEPRIDRHRFCEPLPEFLHALCLQHGGRRQLDRSGLIYGIGHAVYTLSDPRTKVLKKFVRPLAEEKGRMKEFALYELIERIAPSLLSEKRQRAVSANVDFYSGFVYDMLGLPHELFTPLFAMARISGWSAHRIEELLTAGKIIRPAYMAVQPRREYKPMSTR